MFIRKFESKDQIPAKALINAGLGQYFGVVDETLNPDLDDIALSFVHGCFLVGEIDGAVVATGGYKPLNDETVKIERVFVDSKFRRLGISTIYSACFGSKKGRL